MDEVSASNNCLLGGILDENKLSVDAEIDAAVADTFIDGVDDVGDIGGFIVGSMLHITSTV